MVKKTVKSEKYGRMAAMSIKFGSKVYGLHSLYVTKSNAKKFAKDERKKGSLARVITFPRGYGVYLRKKGK